MTTTQQKRTAAKPSDIHDPLKIWLGRLRQRAHLFVNRQTWTLKPNWQAPIHNDGFAVTRQLAVFTVPHLTCVALQTYYVNAHRASRRYDDSRKEKLGAN